MTTEDKMRPNCLDVPWELQAVMSLGRLWQEQDKRAEARKKLAEVYDWFSEGFDMADLKEARALLEELS